MPFQTSDPIIMPLNQLLSSMNIIGSIPKEAIKPLIGPLRENNSMITPPSTVQERKKGRKIAD
ncbi:hypothetical protein D3C76_1749360 [compost metagenome]